MTMSSREIAKYTKKRHDNVMTDIGRMFIELEMFAPDFTGTYKTSRGNEYLEFHLPKRETLILISGYSAKLRAAIIDRWQALEDAELNRLNAAAERLGARLEAPQLTAALKSARELDGKDTQGHHYANEYNLINKLVLGMTAKQYIAEHGFAPSTAIRDTMRPVEIKAIAELQRANTSLIDMGIDYQERKVMLTALYERKFKQLLIDEVMRIES